MKRKILLYPNPILNTISKPVVEFNEEIHSLLADMKDTLDSTSGVGLASIQIGVPLRVLIIKYEDIFMEVINPKITRYEGSRTSLEGCLSLNGVSELVERASYVEVKYQDRNGKVKYMSDNGMLATIIQHEMEHLNGGLYIDSLSSTKKKVLLAKYKSRKGK